MGVCVCARANVEGGRGEREGGDIKERSRCQYLVVFCINTRPLPPTSFAMVTR